MKKMIRAFVLLLVLSRVSAQEKSQEAIYATFDCADDVNSVANKEKCLKLILKGSGAENYKIVSSFITLKCGTTLKEFTYFGEELSQELITAIKKLGAGEKVFIENPIIKHIQTNVTKTLPATKITFK